MLALGVVLGVHAMWILAAELSRPAVPARSLDADTAAQLPASRAAAAEAARMGHVRGDLWVSYALTYAELVWNETASAEMIQAALAASKRAVALAPHEGRIWVLLASLHSHASTSKVAALLRMSYYTAPNEVAVIPVRLLVAARSNALSDGELRELVKWELRSITTHKPDLKPAIKAAYRAASPVARRFLEGSLQDLDPSLLK
jgi:hypothetical protein